MQVLLLSIEYMFWNHTKLIELLIFVVNRNDNWLNFYTGRNLPGECSENIYSWTDTRTNTTTKGKIMKMKKITTVTCDNFGHCRKLWPLPKKQFMQSFYKLSTSPMLCLISKHEIIDRNINENASAMISYDATWHNYDNLLLFCGTDLIKEVTHAFENSCKPLVSNWSSNQFWILKFCCKGINWGRLLRTPSSM